MKTQIMIAAALSVIACKSSSEPIEISEGGKGHIDQPDGGMAEAVDGGMSSNTKPEVDSGLDPNCKHDVIVQASGQWKADSALCFALYFPYTTFNCVYDSANDETQCLSDGGGVDYLVQWSDGEAFYTTLDNKYFGRIDQVDEFTYNTEVELTGGTDFGVCTISFGTNAIKVCER